MDGDQIVRLCEQDVLGDASRLYGTSNDALGLVPGYEGCANLVYEYEQDGRPLILRISFRPDRTAEQIRAELHSISFLAEHGLRVSRPVPS